MGYSRRIRRFRAVHIGRECVPAAAAASDRRRSKLYNLLTTAAAAAARSSNMTIVGVVKLDDVKVFVGTELMGVGLCFRIDGFLLSVENEQIHNLITAHKKRRRGSCRVA